MLTIATLVMAPVALAAPVDNVKMTRAYEADQVHAYALEARMEEGGQDAAIDAEIVFKVKKKTDVGAEVSMSVRKFTMKSGGTDTGSTGPEEISSPFDAQGLPHVMRTESEAWVYILTALAGFVPGKEVELGKEFGVSWESKDKALSVSGKGTASEAEEQEGAKAYKLEYDVEVKPGQDTPGMVKLTSFITRDGMLPIKADGSVSVESASIKFKIKRLKS
jgi:hypothetical protein